MRSEFTAYGSPNGGGRDDLYSPRVPWIQVKYNLSQKRCFWTRHV